MGLFLRRLSIGLLAVLFAASGAAARYCDAAHHSPAAIGALHEQSEPSHHAHAAGHGGPAHQSGEAADHHQGMGDPGAMAGDDHGCSKCCGVCTLVVAMTADAGNAAFFAVSPAMFGCRSEHCSDTKLRVDPGIPKRIF
jgi:hypothetical protein